MTRSRTRGAPALLLERYAGRLEYHDPWHHDREVSHLFRGLVDTFEADEALGEPGLGHLRLVDNGAIRRRSPTLEVEQAHAYHLIPAEASKARAVARHMQARGYAREECIAVGDSREDMDAADVVGAFWLVANALERDPDAARGDRAARQRARGRGRPRGGRLRGRGHDARRARSDLDGRSHSRRKKPAAAGRTGARAAARCVRTSPTQSSRGRSPSMRRHSASVTGASTPARPSARASRGTDSSASTAWPIRAGMSAAGTPWASSSPARRLRLWGASAVATRSPVPGQPDQRLRPRALHLGEAPDLGEDVPGGGAGGVEALCLGRAGGERGGVLRRAGELHADRVVRHLAHHARLGEHPRQRFRQPLVGGRGDEARALRSPSRCAWAGPPMQAMRSGAQLLAQEDRRRGAVGRDEPLGQRDDRRARARPAAASPAITSSSPREGTPRNT